ncbi:hypothetical protein RIF25_07010 [Thermosynechococcaceae cyanobacterium BACA0444]|uniref:Uncharacterized protein n=1 Tax=Pseudocalidococcus azoricus BACA0444 TaxID=2918990 RepID=A0AAE4FRS4_9CYAN|nr:hypothetical protein [Pseudocalidococcus azoricus]MDS3860558.1 hypothetical protein [Pseudocalidococcus azoricus BACA0444]
MSTTVPEYPLERANYLADVAVERATKAGQTKHPIKIEAWLSTDEYDDLVTHLNQLEWEDFVPDELIVSTLPLA